MRALWSYRPRPGPYGELDERARILLALCGVVGVLSTWNPLHLALLLAVAAAIFAASRVSLGEVKRFAIFVSFAIAMLVILTFLTSPAPEPGQVDPRPTRALAQVLRMAGLVTFAVVLPFTLDPARYGLALRRMGVPDVLAFAVELAFRFVPAYAARFQTTVEAQAARGLELDPPGTGLLGRLRRRIPLVVPVALGAVIAGEDLADAMDLRAFGTRRRTWCGRTRWGPREWAALALGLALVAGVWFL